MPAPPHSPPWPGGWILSGYVLDAPRWGTLRAWEDGAIAVQEGRILAVGHAADVAQTLSHWPPHAWRRAPPGQRWLVLPGLIDAHAHLPQYPLVARPADALLPWLQQHIFPAEKTFTAPRPNLPQELDAFFAELAAQGTTTAMLYAATWQDSTNLAFAAAQRSGLRILLGNVLMDRDTYSAPRLTRDAALAQSRELIQTWHRRDRGRLQYVVSPRFALSCSRQLMAQAAALANASHCPLQSHLSENPAEVALVRQRFPEAASYTDVYRRANLLGPRSVFAHAIHLTPPELDLLAASHSAVAHCPTSNLFLHSGLCPLDQLRRHGIRLSLGSDVAAGPELNLWQVMRSAIETQTARRCFLPATPELTPAQALFLATAGGADATGQADAIGTLDPGKEADLTLFDLHAVAPLGGRFAPPNPDPHAIAALMVYRGGPAAWRGSWVRGQPVPAAP